MKYAYTTLLGKFPVAMIDNTDPQHKRYASSIEAQILDCFKGKSKDFALRVTLSEDEIINALQEWSPYAVGLGLNSLVYDGYIDRIKLDEIHE